MCLVHKIIHISIKISILIIHSNTLITVADEPFHDPSPKEPTDSAKISLKTQSENGSRYTVELLRVFLG